jgi:CxxC-x17-CxxC domain-containing protein
LYLVRHCKGLERSCGLRQNFGQPYFALAGAVPAFGQCVNGREQVQRAGGAEGGNDLVALRLKGDPMEFQDRVMKCVDCGADFIFTAGEQLFFHDKQFKNLPKRCKACKQKRAPGKGSAHPAKQETVAICSGCGKETTLPFRPTQGRPVFCRECFGQKNKPSGASA